MAGAWIFERTRAKPSTRTLTDEDLNDMKRAFIRPSPLPMCNGKKTYYRKNGYRYKPKATTDEDQLIQYQAFPVSVPDDANVGDSKPMWVLLPSSWYLFNWVPGYGFKEVKSKFTPEQFRDFATDKRMRKVMVKMSRRFKSLERLLGMTWEDMYQEAMVYTWQYLEPARAQEWIASYYKEHVYKELKGQAAEWRQSHPDIIVYGDAVAAYEKQVKKILTLNKTPNRGGSDNRVYDDAKKIWQNNKKVFRKSMGIRSHTYGKQKTKTPFI